MRYDIYVNRQPLATKYDLQEALDLINKVFIPRSSYMIIEDNGKSQFPIIFIQNQEDLDKILELEKKGLKKSWKYAILRMEVKYEIPTYKKWGRWLFFKIQR